MDALPLRLVAQLRSKGVPIHFGLKVTAIVSQGSDDRVRVFAGKDEIPSDPEFQYVICAVPASATARIEFNPRLSEEKYDALRGLPYQSAAKSLVLVKSRRWETNDRIFGGASYTDLPIQQCWYPSDNAQPIGLTEDEDGILGAMRAQDFGEGPQWELSPEAYGPADVDGWKRPAILTGAYMTGINAERFTSLSDAERTDQVMRCLEEIHPGITDDVDDVKHDVKHCAWIEELTPLGGAWAFLGPGDHQRYQNLLCEPHPSGAPRIFFAGEHLCVLHAWIQSAIQSSLEAVMAVLEAP
jgi:monoamine oxidase